VNGGLAFGCNRAKSCSAPSGRALLTRNPLLRRYAWRRKPKATESRRTAARGAQHHAGRPGVNLGHAAPKAPGGLEPGVGCAIAGREAGGRAAHLLSREGVLDREGLRRVTATGLKRSRRVSPGRKSAHRENAQRRHRVRFATGASEARHAVTWARNQTWHREEHAPTKVARSAEAIGAS